MSSSSLEQVSQREAPASIATPDRPEADLRPSIAFPSPQGSVADGSPATGEAAFSPIFIVGCQRSGTTALAVMFDRHSTIAMLPETQFFNKFLESDRRIHGAGSALKLARRALADPEIRNVQLRAEEVLAAFRDGKDGYPELFRAILSSYSRKHGKSRAAEKSCGHLFAAKQILRLYPNAKIICIIRDGRDVVRSLMKVSWGRSVPLPLACLEWLRFARRALRYRRQIPPESFTLVRYEDLMLKPEPTLRRLCEFADLSFEDRQLRSGTDTDVVPESELEWKGKAMTSPDASRVEAWRRNAEPLAIARINFYMGDLLRELGYVDTKVQGVSPATRLLWNASFLPFQRWVYPMTRQIYRALRSLGLSPIDVRPSKAGRSKRES